MTIFGVGMALARNPYIVEALKKPITMWSHMVSVGCIIKICRLNKNANIWIKQLGIRNFIWTGTNRLVHWS
jgi:hypothetical protein